MCVPDWPAPVAYLSTAVYLFEPRKGATAADREAASGGGMMSAIATETDRQV